ncbi:hypothetical protein PINS_up008007 [Pythium insidiosum]|nr:hypothetical protein PINS_up008007 [Pythium insidiosum]
MATRDELTLLVDKAPGLQTLLPTQPTLFSRCLHVVGWDRMPPRMQGIALVAASAFTFSWLSVLIKYASYSMTSMETVFWRSVVAWLLNLVAIRSQGVSLIVPREFWTPLATRCLVGSCSMAVGFYAMQQMVLADASVLIFMSPMITFFLGALFLGEHIDAGNLGCALFSFVGVICVSRPTFIFGESDATAGTDPSFFAVCCALLGATGQAIVYVCMRRLKGLHFMATINYFLLTSTLFSAFSLAFIQQTFVIHMPLSVWLAVLGTGVFGFLGQLFMTRGFQLENAGTASVMRYLDVVFVFIWDLTLLHERISAWSVLGAVIICSSAIAIAIRRMNHHH